MSVSNVTNIFFGDKRSVYSPNLYQYDYGQKLKFADLELPVSYEVHFSNNKNSGVSKTQLGDASGVKIPDEFIQTGETVYAWLFLHSGAYDGRTMYMVTIPMVRRPELSNVPPTEVEQSIITQAMAALQYAVEQTADDVESADQSAEDAEAWAVGTRKGTAVPLSDETYENNAKYYAGLTAADATATAAAARSTAADAEATAADRLQTSSDRIHTAEDRQQTGLDRIQTGEDRQQTGLDRIQTGADRVQTGLDAAAATEQAQAALQSAERAEQSAAQAGYMFFYINDDGDLIYQRTSNVEVDFYLHDGDLYVRAVN